MKKISVIGLLLSVSILAGCTFSSVPPAHKGKILSPAGYSEDVLEPGKVTLMLREGLVLLDASTATFKESMEVVMRDKLTLRFDVRFRARVRGENNVINAVFNDIIPVEGQISLAKVYEVYGQMSVRNKARSVLSQYTIEDVNLNYERISADLYDAIMPTIEGTPIQMSDVVLANIKYPDVVTRAIEEAKGREMEIEREKAQAKIELTKKENERLLAEADYQIRITRAKAIRDENRLIAEGVTDDLLEFRRLEVIEALGNNQNTVFMPVEGLVSPGAQMRIYGK